MAEWVEWHHKLKLLGDHSFLRQYVHVYVRICAF